MCWPRGRRWRAARRPRWAAAPRSASLPPRGRRAAHLGLHAYGGQLHFPAAQPAGYEQADEVVKAERRAPPDALRETAGASVGAGEWGGTSKTMSPRIHRAHVEPPTIPPGRERVWPSASADPRWPGPADGRGGRREPFSRWMAPGPEVAMQTPISPVNLAWAQAMKAPISSWRDWMSSGSPSARSSAPRKPLIPSPGIAVGPFDPPGPQALEDVVRDQRGHRVSSLDVPADGSRAPAPPLGPRFRANTRGRRWTRQGQAGRRPPSRLLAFVQAGLPVIKA